MSLRRRQADRDARWRTIFCHSELQHCDRYRIFKRNSPHRRNADCRLFESEPAVCVEEIRNPTIREGAALTTHFLVGDAPFLTVGSRIYATLGCASTYVWAETIC